jgi:hypothetical protein
LMQNQGISIPQRCMSYNLITPQAQKYLNWVMKMK